MSDREEEMNGEILSAGMDEKCLQGKRGRDGQCEKDVDKLLQCLFFLGKEKRWKERFRVQRKRNSVGKKRGIDEEYRKKKGKKKRRQNYVNVVEEKRIEEMD